VFFFGLQFGLLLLLLLLAIGYQLASFGQVRALWMKADLLLEPARSFSPGSSPILKDDRSAT